MKRAMLGLAVVTLAGLVGVTALSQPSEKEKRPERQDRSGPGGPPGRGGPGGRPGFLPPNPLIEVLDLNRDGILSPAELKVATKSLLKLDRNKDGKLTSTELHPRGFGGPPPFGGPDQGRGGPDRGRGGSDRGRGGPEGRPDRPEPDPENEVKAPGGIQWYPTLDGGLAEAKRTGRPILLISAAPHCAGVSGIW